MKNPLTTHYYSDMMKALQESNINTMVKQSIFRYLAGINEERAEARKNKRFSIFGYEIIIKKV